MTQGDDSPNIDPDTTTTATWFTTLNDNRGQPEGNEYKSDQSERTPTDTVAAVTIAVLSVVIVLTLLLVFRALRKRRRQRQGRQLNEVATVSTGIMGTSISAYGPAVLPVTGGISWEPVTRDDEHSDRTIPPEQGASGRELLY